MIAPKSIPVSPDPLLRSRDRIANGLSQRELADRLADRLGVSEPQVSCDECNEYHGITIERAQRILDLPAGQEGLGGSGSGDVQASQLRCTFVINIITDVNWCRGKGCDAGAVPGVRVP